MTVENITEWFRRQNHRVAYTESSYWFDASPLVYQAIPYHRLITPSDDELRNFFSKNKAIAIRYSAPLDHPEGQLSYHVIYDKTNYELSDLPKKARHDVTKGLQYASYETIPLSRLANEGWNLRKETLMRQGRQNAETKRFWETLCLSADGLSSFEAWGALHEGQLVSALLACTIDDTVNIYYQQSLTRHLKFGINNALTFVFTHEVLKRAGIRTIFYGLHSLDAPSSVDSYKFRMGYIPKPVRQRVVINPQIAPLIRPFTHTLIKALMKILPQVPQIAKAEGMARFYLQGKQAISEQEWPDILSEMRATVFAMAGK